MGRLQDGSIIFNLGGVYNTVTKDFFLSAASSVLVYELTGTLLANGDIATGAEATFKILSGGVWNSTTIPVQTASNVSTGNPNQTQVGLPSAWFGTWVWEGKCYVDCCPGGNHRDYITFTATQYINHQFEDIEWGFLDIIPAPPAAISAGATVGTMEMVWEMRLDGGCGDCSDQECIFCNVGGNPAYAKIWMNVSGGILSLIAFEDSFSATFAGAKEYTNYGPNREGFEVKRP